MRKKMLIIILVILMLVGVFFIGRQVGLNTEKSKTTTLITEEAVSNHDIKKTLTGSGQVSAKTTEKLELTTTKYFEAMCVEEDDTVQKGEKILKYTNGTYLTAPYNLVIESIDVPETQNICTTSNYIEVSNLTTLETSISISENEINDVKEGQEVEITLNADETKTYTGSISKIDSIGNYSSSGTTFSAIVEFENDGNIKIGMSLSCTVILEEEKEVACVPISAVYENDEGKEYVNKIKDDGTTEQVIIETGIADDSYVQVISGLEINDKVQILTEITESTSSSNSQTGLTGMNKGMGGDKDKNFSGEMPSGNMGGERQNDSGGFGEKMPSGNMPEGNK